MTYKELIKDIEIKEIYEKTTKEITGITNNSREIKKDFAFVAVRGFQTDGHKYIRSAAENGAAVIIAEEYTEGIACTQIIVTDSRRAEAVAAANYYGRPSENFKLIGITGTNGKTTVTYLVKQILERQGKRVGLIGTNQNMIGDRVIETGRTTPDSIELQKLFSDMAKDGVDFCIMEVSSHALFLDRVYGCNYEVGAFTNLTQDHLDFHGTMENYAKAKQILFSMSKHGVVNADDAYAETMLGGKAEHFETYGVHADAALKAEHVQLTQRGVSFSLQNTDFELGIPGEFSVYNALCAIGVAKNLGVSLADIASALKDAHGVKGRAEIVKTDTDYTVMIDYAHTPDGIENILKTVRGFASGRVVIVFGCGGDRDNTKRPIMGKIAGELADFCVVTSDNPRTENPSRIIEMVEAGVKETSAEYVVIENRKEAIAYALNHAQKDDVIVLAGKGHETYQILNSGTIHFDEREVVQEILHK